MLNFHGFGAVVRSLAMLALAGLASSTEPRGRIVGAASPQQDTGSSPQDAGADAATAEVSPEESEAAFQELLESPEVRQIMTDFDTAHQELVVALGDLREAHLIFGNGIDQSESAREEYRSRRDAVRAALKKTHRAANKAMMFRNREAFVYVLTMVESNEKRSIYDLDTYESAAKLLDFGRKDKNVFSAALRSAVSHGQFETARSIFEVLQGQDLPDVDRKIQVTLDEIEADYEIERQRQERDKDKTLPKVRFHTTNGDFVAELYIEEAPSAVSHFIGLVEDEHFEDLEFFQVIDDLLALCGDPNDNPGDRFLKDEHEAEDARKALRGSLVMANIPLEQGDFLPDSASNRFAILMLPLPWVTEKQTVFGRVVEGMDVVSTFQRVDPGKEKKKGELTLPPDRVLSAEILDRPDTLPEPVYVETGRGESSF